VQAGVVAVGTGGLPGPAARLRKQAAQLEGVAAVPEAQSRDRFLLWSSVGDLQGHIGRRIGVGSGTGQRLFPARRCLDGGMGRNGKQGGDQQNGRGSDEVEPHATPGRCQRQQRCSFDRHHRPGVQHGAIGPDSKFRSSGPEAGQGQSAESKHGRSQSSSLRNYGAGSILTNEEVSVVLRREPTVSASP
jgi:hypothetical protein